MRTKTIKESVYKTEKIGEKDKIIYIAIDGEEFTDKNECKNHERDLQTIFDAEKYIIEVKLGDEQESVSTFIFGGYNVSSARFFKWTATKDKKIIEPVCEYLGIIRAQGHCYGNLKMNSSYFKSELEEFEEGDKVLISFWTEREGLDYPSYEIGVIKCDDAIKIINELSDKMKSVFTYNEKQLNGEFEEIEIDCPACSDDTEKLHYNNCACCNGSKKIKFYSKHKWIKKNKILFKTQD